jgi:hypothetical protein
LHLALDLTERLPATLACLERGEIDLLRARLISDATAQVRVTVPVTTLLGLAQARVSWPDTDRSPRI